MANSIDYYLSKGFDIKAATYFASGRRIVTNVEANDDFTLTILFDNGERRLYDMKPHLKSGTVFATFTDINNFRRVYLDENNVISWDIVPEIDSNTHWDNKVDIGTDLCYMDSVLI